MRPKVHVFLVLVYSSSKSKRDKSLDPRNSALYNWRRKITNYSLRGMSKSQDKLVAISGVAKYLQASIQADYLAGLWNIDFPLELLWYVPKKGSRAPVFVAPTWSWASIHAQVYLLHDDKYPLQDERLFMVDILEVNMVMNTRDKFGQVLSGTLKLQGWLRIFETESPYGDESLLLRYKDKRAVVRLDEEHAEYHGKWYCLPIAGRRSTCRVSGLLLERTGSSPHQYQRVGLWYTMGGHKEPFNRPAFPKKSSKTKITFTTPDSSASSEATPTQHISFPDSENSGSVEVDRYNEWVKCTITII
ncbi:hypothetical protein N431DRAFT_442890 [Stipitochalara longipes BDJ]|nr:hypothetical protein N431DRAFT_442890 [Stipitochalara longipes BDJ]